MSQQTWPYRNPRMSLLERLVRWLGFKKDRRCISCKQDKTRCIWGRDV